MNNWDWLSDYFNRVSDWFYFIYLYVYDWVAPFNVIANFFYYLSDLASKIAWRFWYLSQWAQTVDWDLVHILDWTAIRSHILGWLPSLEDAVNWFFNWWGNITSAITSWWSYTSSTVQGWIDIATQGFDNLVIAWNSFWTITFPSWTSKLDILKVAWDNFCSVTFPTLVDFSWLGIWWESKWKEVDSLIDSVIQSYFPFYNSLAELWQVVVDFILDPLGWLEERFTNWFLGAE